jgi:hypothetical protein
MVVTDALTYRRAAFGTYGRGTNVQEPKAVDSMAAINGHRRQVPKIPSIEAAITLDRARIYQQLVRLP